MLSQQNVSGPKMTYSLSRHQRKQTRDQWTECTKTEIDDLLAVEASEEANPSSVDRIHDDRNQ